MEKQKKNPEKTKWENAQTAHLLYQYFINQNQIKNENRNNFFSLLREERKICVEMSMISWFSGATWVSEGR
jgi:hypothetical protein